MKSWCRSGQSCFKTCDLTLSQLSLSFQLGYSVILTHTHTHTLAHTLTHSLCLSDTDSALSALGEKTEAHTISTASQWGDAAKSRQSSHSTGAFRCTREKETTSEGGKLAPCQHKIGVLLTEERHRLKERKADLLGCGWYSSDMISLPSLKSWPVCDLDLWVFCFWWLCCHGFLKEIEQRGFQRRRAF